ncbi:MAG: hypothetical protein L3J96_02560, partial [Thermoplasmata archaeon]|nr:hypothetical protein [Thermoplasmata archaeon]
MSGIWIGLGTFRDNASDRKHRGASWVGRVLTGLLVGVFVGLIVLTTDVLALSGPVAVAASTLAAAALLAPVR